MSATLLPVLEEKQFFEKCPDVDEQFKNMTREAKLVRAFFCLEQRATFREERHSDGKICGVFRFWSEVSNVAFWRLEVKKETRKTGLASRTTARIWPANDNPYVAFQLVVRVPNQFGKAAMDASTCGGPKK